MGSGALGVLWGVKMAAILDFTKNSNLSEKYGNIVCYVIWLNILLLFVTFHMFFFTEKG